MASVKTVEELDIWQQAFDLYKKRRPLLSQLQDAQHFERKNQLERSAGSVMDHIAEGFERDGNRAFTQFLSVSKGSLAEVRSQRYAVSTCLNMEKQETEV